MKITLLTILLISFSSSIFAQALPAHTYPAFSKRPAFQLEEEIDIDSELPQKELLKSYLKYYAHKKLVRMAAIDYLNLQFKARSVFRKSDFDIFKIFKNKREPLIENDLSFENQAIDFSNFISYDYGFCMGVTSTLRKFNMLAHFDPSNTMKANVPLRQLDEKKWKNYYYKLIDQVMSNKPTVFPYFKNLEDLSEYGMFYTYLQRHAIDQWALNNMSIRAGLSDMLLGIKAKTTRYSNYRLYKKLKSRLALNYNPKMYLSKPGSLNKTEDIWIHVVQVYKISERKADGSYTIHLWDPNFPASHEFSKGIVEVSSNGDAYFMEGAGVRTPQKLSKLGIYKYDDAEIAEILLNYKLFCKKHPKLCSN